MRQAAFLANIIKAIPGNVILCGDFNEDQDGGGLKMLIEQTGLQDADAASRRPTFTSDNPVSRIDYILHSPGLRATHVEVIESLASDHLPLLVDFECN